MAAVHRWAQSRADQALLRCEHEQAGHRLTAMRLRVLTDGARIGKGAGYSHIELGLLGEVGAITAHTVIVTTVHPLQIIDGPLPESAHDFRVDAIVTPDTVITCRRSPRPAGIMWDHLTRDKIAGIPALAARRQRTGESPDAAM
jgi:hypothetical protein